MQSQSSILRRFLSDECGAVLSAELVVLGTLVLIGTLVGISSLRTAVVQEFGDASLALHLVNQGYSFAPLSVSADGIAISANGSEYRDRLDFCVSLTDSSPRRIVTCISINAGVASAE